MLLYIFLTLIAAALLAHYLDVKRGYNFKSKNESLREALGDYVAPQYENRLSEAYKKRYRKI